MYVIGKDSEPVTEMHQNMKQNQISITKYYCSTGYQIPHIEVSLILRGSFCIDEHIF
jgi:hypothetical protein